MTKTPLVVDMFSGEELESSKTGTAEDFKKIYASGIRGIIHKATQGAGYRDKECLRRRDLAQSAGLLWGYYHFGTAAPVADQVANFLSVVGANAQTCLLALDYEKNEPNPSDSMSLAQAKQFLQMVYEKAGQRPVLYSGSMLKEQLPQEGDAFISKHRLWLAQYGEHASLPHGFSKYWLHQYTGDGVGPLPHSVPGIKTKGIDLNVFGGVDLSAEWAPTSEALLAAAFGGSEVGAAATAAPAKPTASLATLASIGKTAQTIQASHSLWAIINGWVVGVIAMFTDWLQHCFTWIVSLITDITQTVDDTGAIDSASKLQDWLQIDQAKILKFTLAVVAVVSIIVFVRHLRDKQAAPTPPAAN